MPGSLLQSCNFHLLKASRQEHLSAAQMSYRQQAMLIKAILRTTSRPPGTWLGPEDFMLQARGRKMGECIARKLGSVTYGV